MYTKGSRMKEKCLQCLALFLLGGDKAWEQNKKLNRIRKMGK